MDAAMEGGFGRRRVPASAEGETVAYLDKPGLVGLVLKNLLLTVVTLTFYRFWARTRLRRYFWSNIAIAGEPLEYTGTGLELFVGFLIALAILVPFGISYYLLERLVLGDAMVSIAVRLLYFLAVAILIQTASFRARRYRLSRTAWRGIRAGQTGSTWHYVGLSFLWGLLCLVTLGLAVPWADVALERYKINHSWFGESRFRLDASGRALFSRWFLVLALLYLPIAVAFLVNESLLADALQAAGQPHRAPGHLEHPGAFGLLLIPAFGGLPALIWYRVASFRYLASSTRLADSPLDSCLRARRIIWIVLRFLLAHAGLVLIGGVIVAGVVWLFVWPDPGHAASPLERALERQLVLLRSEDIILGMFVLMWPISRLLNYCWLRAPIIRHLASTLTIGNLTALEQTVQSAQPRQKFGEGLADSFELGTF